MSQAKKSSIYKKIPYKICEGHGVTKAGSGNKREVRARHRMPGNIILVHGVNDVGVGYEAVERGLCEGLTTRLDGEMHPAKYRMPQASDRKKLEDDPDAVFYKRKISKETESPVIPFYWGYREETAKVSDWRKTSHGQAVDRYGNRLDRDYAKGGGPFGNATISLTEMWGQGKGNAGGALDMAARDATRPVLKNPGRLYMVLAARRLSALISMIRDYDNDETISLVAHSQGCMVSLLAQAFLLDPAMQEIQPNARPADTLILCNPPYSLIDELPLLAELADGASGSDTQMAKENRYRYLLGGLSQHARLKTLANIVRGVTAHPHASPHVADLSNAQHHGAVGPGWKASADRDNRGKVYLYFSPEDMTVALSNIQGIGWQGVPDFLRGYSTKLRRDPRGSSLRDDMGINPKVPGARIPVMHTPLQDMGSRFFQRVFTMKRRPDPIGGSLEKIGGPPHDFALRVPGEDDFSHTAVSDTWANRRGVRQSLPDAAETTKEQAQSSLRSINGEPLPSPVLASMDEGSIPDEQGRLAASEHVDQIDAAIAVTSKYGLNNRWECITNVQFIWEDLNRRGTTASPAPSAYVGLVAQVPNERLALEARLNAGKKDTDKCRILRTFVCVDRRDMPRPIQPLKVLIERTETPNEARKRWQQTTVPRSFHSAIYGGRKNHSQVTAYDVAIGGGKAVSDPLFYQYLCAVADWRLKKPRMDEEARPGILTQDDFLTQFSVYWHNEKAWRKALIEGNIQYYSVGKLPDCLPLPPDLPPTLVIKPMES